MVRVIADWTVRMGLLLWRYQSERWRQIQVIRCRHAETSCSLLGDLVRSTLSQLFLFLFPAHHRSSNSIMTIEEPTPAYVVVISACA